VIPPVRWPGNTVQCRTSQCRRLLRVMRPISGCSRPPPRCRSRVSIDSPSFGDLMQAINWPDRNGHGKLCRTKALLLHFVGQHGNNNDAGGHRSQDRGAARLVVAAGSTGRNRCAAVKWANSRIRRDTVLVRFRTSQCGLLRPILI